ncbi:MAG: anti-sigma factor [Actinobacteria bacterium]|nr:anti-sigma factor [Actinomycetota bacterium]
MTSDADIHTLSAPYALDALPDDERRAFESHLATCPGCRREVDELRAAAASLAVPVEEPAPRPLRDRILTTIEVTAQDPGPTGQQNHPTWTWPQIRNVVAIAAAAIVVIVAGLGAVIAELNGSIDDLQARTEAAYDVLAAGELRTVTLTGTFQGKVQLIASARADQAIIVAQGLPVIDDSRTYELWFIDTSGARPAGLFRPDQHGRTFQVVAHGDLSGVEQVAVTIEPANGSRQPTSEPVLTATL